MTLSITVKSDIHHNLTQHNTAVYLERHFAEGHLCSVTFMLSIANKIVVTTDIMLGVMAPLGRSTSLCLTKIVQFYYFQI